ncbi:uncharacterized protein METZ01_LOCUS128623, partial [marine metagenome]
HGQWHICCRRNRAVSKVTTMGSA